MQTLHCIVAAPSPGARPLRWGLAKSKSSDHVSGGAGWLMCSYCALSGDDISLAACKTYFALSARSASHSHTLCTGKRAAGASRLTRIIIIYIYTHKEEEGWMPARRLPALRFFLNVLVGWKRKAGISARARRRRIQLSAAFKEIRL